jgi:hypothetical protein
VADIRVIPPLSGDYTPDQFTFVDQIDVALNSTVTSAPITITGVSPGVVIPLSLDTGLWSKDGVNFVSGPGNVTLNDQVYLQHTSSDLNSTPTTQTLTIGGVQDTTFTTTTIAGGAGPADLTVVYSGDVIPPGSLLFQDEGRASQIGSSTSLTDTSKTWVVNEFAGFRVKNTSDFSSALITSNTQNTLTFSGGLTGGRNNTVTQYNYYEIVTDISANDEIHYSSTTSAGGTVTVSAKGVPSILGANGPHTLSYFFVDVSAAETSPTYSLTVTV